jgi:hypothetical protein
MNPDGETAIRSYQFADIGALIECPLSAQPLVHDGFGEGRLTSH